MHKSSYARPQTAKSRRLGAIRGAARRMVASGIYDSPGFNRFYEKDDSGPWPSRVYEIDEYGQPWIRAKIRERGKLREHFWAIFESTGWRRVSRRG